MTKKVDTTVAGSPSRDSQGYAIGQWIGKLATFESELALHASLDPATRRVMHAVIAHCPDAAVEQLSAIAAQNGGTILGLPFDPDGAREVVAYAAAATPLVLALRALAQHIEDDVIQRQVQVADKVRASLDVMKASMRTAEGRALRPQYTAIRSMLGRPRKAAATAPTAPAPTAPAPPAGGASAGNVHVAPAQTIVVPVSTTLGHDSTASKPAA